MRLPIVLMLAVIVFTPANIGEVARDAFGRAGAMVTAFIDRDGAPSMPTDKLLVAERK